MSITTEQIQGVTGKVYSQNSEKVGSVGQIYLDDNTGTPSWVTVKTGLFGSSETFVPLEGARVDGDDLYVAFAEDRIKDAPRVESDGSITPQEEDQLYTYYGLSGSGGKTDTYTDRGTDDRTDVGAGERRTGVTDDDNARYEKDRGTAGDGTMTRSEEQLKVGTQNREAGKARLRKFVTTEKVTQTVPVQREEVTIEREPISGGNAVAGSATIGEEEHEVVLHEEVPVVDKDVVAVEQIKLGKETVTDEATVTEEVRKENVEVATDADKTTSGDKNRKR